jgi:hypothetical protein
MTIRHAGHERSDPDAIGFPGQPGEQRPSLETGSRRVAVERLEVVQGGPTPVSTRGPACAGRVLGFDSARSGGEVVKSAFGVFRSECQRSPTSSGHVSGR